MAERSRKPIRMNEDGRESIASSDSGTTAPLNKGRPNGLGIGKSIYNCVYNSPSKKSTETSGSPRPGPSGLCQVGENEEEEGQIDEFIRFPGSGNGADEEDCDGASHLQDRDEEVHYPFRQALTDSLMNTNIEGQQAHGQNVGSNQDFKDDDDLMQAVIEESLKATMKATGLGPPKAPTKRRHRQAVQVKRERNVEGRDVSLLRAAIKENHKVSKGREMFEGVIKKYERKSKKKIPGSSVRGGGPANPTLPMRTNSTLDKENVMPKRIKMEEEGNEVIVIGDDDAEGDGESDDNHTLRSSEFDEGSDDEEEDNSTTPNEDSSVSLGADSDEYKRKRSASRYKRMEKRELKESEKLQKKKALEEKRNAVRNALGNGNNGANFTTLHQCKECRKLQKELKDGVRCLNGIYYFRIVNCEKCLTGNMEMACRSWRFLSGATAKGAGVKVDAKANDMLAYVAKDDFKPLYGRHGITIAQCGNCQIHQKGLVASVFCAPGPSPDSHIIQLVNCASCVEGNSALQQSYWRSFLTFGSGGAAK